MYNIYFDFDEKSKKISNVVIMEQTLGISPKQPYIEVLNNKVRINDAAISLIGAKFGDRISINYWTVDNETTFPVIGLSEAFTDGNDGNKLTKSGTIAYRGSQRETLLKYGNLFKVETFKDKMFRLTKIEESIDSTENDFTDIEDMPE